MASTACGGDGNGDGARASDSGGQNDTSESRRAACRGCYRGHGVSFNYPPNWRKTEDFAISDLWSLTLVARKPLDFVKVVGEGQARFGFRASNLGAFRAQIVDQLKEFGFRVQPGAERLRVDRRAGLRFRATLQKPNQKPIEETFVITFKGKTLYRFECAHRERASEIERGCAEIVRNFRVGKT
jgi:hypothetical protein